MSDTRILESKHDHKQIGTAPLSHFRFFDVKATAPLSIATLHAELKQKTNSSFSQVSLTSINPQRLIPLSTDELFHQTGEMIEMAESEVCMQLYKLNPYSANYIKTQKLLAASKPPQPDEKERTCYTDAGRIFIDAIKKRHARATKEKKKIQFFFIVNARGFLAQAFYRKNEPTILEDLAKELNNEYFQINIATHEASSFGSFHTKFIIADGKAVMLRGMDIGFTSDLANQRHESAMLGDQALAHVIREDFIRSWNSLCCSNLKMNSLQSEEKSHQAFKSIPCLFISKKETGIPTTTTPGPYKVALLKAIESAQSSIKIATANLNDPEIIAALAKACNRNLQVCCIMGKYHNDNDEQKWGGTNRQSMKKLITQMNRDKLHNLQIHWATDASGQLVNSPLKHVIHSKYVCIDDCIVFTGSSPIDKQAMIFSREADVIFESPAKAVEFNAKFFDARFRAGRDFFDDAYVDMQTEILKLLNAIRTSSTTSSLAKRTAMRLRTTMAQEIESQDPDEHSFQKSARLIKALMVVLEEGIESKNNIVSSIRQQILQIAASQGMVANDLVRQRSIELSISAAPSKKQLI